VLVTEQLHPTHTRMLNAALTLSRA
jgi:hypothetical protein